MLAEGNIALVPDDDSLRSFMQGLPVFFLGELVPVFFFSFQSTVAAISDRVGGVAIVYDT